MSKKRKIKSKKAKTLLKGVVAVGAAVGGVDVLGDANLVYAAKGEFEQFNDSTSEIVMPSYAEKTLAEEAADCLAGGTNEETAPAESSTGLDTAG